MDSLRGRRTVSTLSVRGGFDAAQAKARDKAKAKARRSDTICLLYTSDAADDTASV